MKASGPAGRLGGGGAPVIANGTKASKTDCPALPVIGHTVLTPELDAAIGTLTKTASAYQRAQLAPGGGRGRPVTGWCPERGAGRSADQVPLVW